MFRKRNVAWIGIKERLRQRQFVNLAEKRGLTDASPLCKINCVMMLG